MEGLAGIDSRGRIAWVNNVAARLLGVAQGGPGLRADEVFGLGVNHLVALTRDTHTMHRLPNGLNIWLGARMQAHDGAAQSVFQAVPATTPPPPVANAPAATATSTLRDSDRDLIARTVQACGGNVSKAARTLGVSRGLVYRHLKDAAAN
jgi:DNA-binding NtrC family response regulator